MLDKTRGEEETAIDVQTIDRFQGSENRIIIASLVRSNPEGNIGHLFAQNRLCVTVSRARSGLYLCGNAETLSQKSPHWKTLIDECFRSQNYLGERIFLTCPRHPHDLSIPLHHKDAQNFSPNVCDRPCKALLACGHHCINTCHYGEHGLCKVEVPYIFEKCKHSTTKLCSESDTSLKCLEEVWITLETCGHTKKCMCWEKNEKVSSALACTFPCGKTLVCEHPCTLFCSQECGSKPCPKCAEIERVKAQKEKELLLKQIKEKTSIIDGEIEKLKSEPRVGPSFKDLLPEGETAAEYRMVQDRTEKFIQPTHETLPVVTRIEKVINLKLQLQFLQAQRALTDVLAPSQLLFYGTDDEGVKSITSKGFQLRRASKNNMFGTGCYFAIDSSKSAHQLYTKGSNKLLLCEVLLGRPWSLNSAKPDLNFGLVQSKMYDSVFSMRNGVESEETEYDDYIIYKPSQAIPRYVVHYKNLDCSASELQSLCENKADRKFERRVLNASASSYNGVTSDELHFRFAEAQFLRMSNKGRQQVEKVEYTWNEELHERYQKRKQQLEAEEKPVDEKLVFHGTKKENIEKIIREGFKVGGEGVAIRCGAVYGNGVYTAANPEISMPYSSGSGMMLLSVALCGKLNEDYSLGASADIYVVKKGDQLLPRYIVHFRKRNSAPS